MTLVCSDGYESGIFKKTRRLTEGKVYEAEVLGEGSGGYPCFLVYDDSGEWSTFDTKHFMPVAVYDAWKKFNEATNTTAQTGGQACLTRR
jgi:hypothetical protein